MRQNQTIISRLNSQNNHHPEEAAQMSTSWRGLGLPLRNPNEFLDFNEALKDPEFQNQYVCKFLFPLKSLMWVSSDYIADLFIWLREPRLKKLVAKTFTEPWQKRSVRSSMTDWPRIWTSKEGRPPSSRRSEWEKKGPFWSSEVNVFLITHQVVFFLIHIFFRLRCLEVALFFCYGYWIPACCLRSSAQRTCPLWYACKSLEQRRRWGRRWRILLEVIPNANLVSFYSLFIPFNFIISSFPHFFYIRAKDANCSRKYYLPIFFQEVEHICFWSICVNLMMICNQWFILMYVFRPQFCIVPLCVSL